MGKSPLISVRGRPLRRVASTSATITILPLKVHISIITAAVRRGTHPLPANITRLACSPRARAQRLRPQLFRSKQQRL